MSFTLVPVYAQDFSANPIGAISLMATSFPIPEGSYIIVPGGPEHPIALPPAGGSPEHPIVMPPPPPGIWPPPVGIWPPTPLPPDYPMPPGSIWPSPGVPTHPIAPGGPPPVVGGGPVIPGTPAHPITSQKLLVAIVAASQGGGITVVGYTVVDPSLSVGSPLPPAGTGTPPHPDQGLPPTAQPRR